MYPTANFKQLYVLAGDSSTDTYPDLGRLVLLQRDASSGLKYARIRVDPVPYITDGGTGTVTMPMIISASYYGPYFYTANSGIDCVVPLVVGQGDTSSSTNPGIIYHLNSNVLKFENWVCGQQKPVVTQSTATSQLQWGNVYCVSTTVTGETNKLFLNKGSYTNEGTTHTFLSNSVYFLGDSNSNEYVSGTVDIALKPIFINRELSSRGNLH